jgi:hypothetical protein
MFWLPVLSVKECPVKKTAWCAAWLIVVGPTVSLVNAEATRAKPKKAANVQVYTGEVPQGTGTITYDTGVNAGFHPDAGQRVVGNRFNSALGGPLTTGMVTMITLFPALSGGQSLSVLGPPSPGGTAMIIDFQNANLMANAFNVVTMTTAVPVGPDFLATFIGFYVAGMDGLLGMSDMANGNQGYHAFSGVYVGAIMGASMLMAVPARNAMIRASGDMLVPVELMEFKIQ